VGGFSYVACQRLTYLAAEHWYEIDGQSARQGVNPLRLSLRRFYNHVYSLYVENLDEEKRIAFDRDLFMPSLTRNPERVDPDVIEDEMAAFRALSRQIGR